MEFGSTLSRADKLGSDWNKPNVHGIFTLLLIKWIFEKANYLGQCPKAWRNFDLELP